MLALSTLPVVGKSHARTPEGIEDRGYAAGRELRRMEALDAQKTETDENSSGALGAGENGGGSHQLQSPGSTRAPTSKSECTKNCNRSKCGFLFDDRLNYADADMVCVSVHDDTAVAPRW